MIDVKRRVRCESLEEAVKAHAKLRAESLGDGDRARLKRLRLGDYARSWLNGRLPTLKPSTAERYADTLERIILPRLGDHYLEPCLRRTANDLIRRVASGEVARAITGHVTVAMTDHYAHVDTGEKRAAVEGMLRLIQGGGGGQPSDDGVAVQEAQETSRNISRNLAPENRNIVVGAAEPEKKEARFLRRNRAFLGAGEGT
jgi:hypothetical protein